jgi:hypothetical protein
MKKRVLVGLIAVVAAAVLFWQLTGRAASPQLERFLPADTIAFVEGANLSEQVLRLVETKAWQAFSRAHPEAASGALLGANYSGLLRADVAAGLVRLKTNGDRAEPVGVVLAESDNADFKGNVEAFISGRFGEKATTTEYRGVTITTYDGDRGPRLSTAQLDDLFIFSDRVDGTKEVIDAAGGHVPSLATSARLTAVRQRLGYTDGLFGFVDAEQARRALHEAHQMKWRSRHAGDVEQVIQALGVDSVTAIGGACSFEDGGMVERFRVEIPNGGTGVVRSLLRAPAGPRQILSVIPAGAGHVFVATVSDPSTVYDQLHQVFQRAASPRCEGSLEAELAELGVDLKSDVVAALGGEMAIVEVPGSSSRHRVAGIVQVHDPERIAQSFKQVAAKKDLALDEATYAGRPFLTLHSGSRANHKIHLAFVDSFLVSGDEDAVRAVIDAQASGRTMAAAAEYQQAFGNRASSSLFTFYSTNDRLLGLMSQTLGRGTAGAPVAATEKLFPTALYGVAESDGLYIESRSPLGTVPHILTNLLRHTLRR